MNKLFRPLRRNLIATIKTADLPRQADENLCLTKNPCFVHAWTLLPWADSNRRPHSPQELVLNRLFHRDDLLLSDALPTELHDTPYIFIHHTSSWQPHQPTPYDAEPIRTIGLAIRILYYSFIMLRCYRNHSAFNSHNFPRTYTTTYPYVAAPPQPNALTRKAQGFGNYLVSSGCTYGLDTVSFHSICIEISFATVSAQSFARPLAGLLSTHLAIVFSVNSAYLPGLSLHVPRRLWKGPGSNRRTTVSMTFLRYMLYH